MAADPRLLLDRLRDSGLLSPDQLKELGQLPEAKDQDPRALGRELLRRGWLTRYQINLIAQGRGKELHLGPYIVLDSLGEGAMGQVFKAQHQHMGRVVALKVIRKEKLTSPATVQRFYQEVRAAAQLSHPNIVIAYDAGNIGPTHYLSMEYVDGIDLARLVKDSGPLSVAQACDFICQAAEGLQHAHERGLVHRDIKPSNLLVSHAHGSQPVGFGTVKILDMGLARLQGLDRKELGVTQAGAVIGTPDYLAPEQAVDARAADIRADLYSLGCTFYFLLTGQPPFTGASLTELLLKHQMEQAMPVEQRRPDVPPGVAAIVRKLMAKRPEDRFQTPAELIGALKSGGETANVTVPLALEAAAKPTGPGSPWDLLADEQSYPAREPEVTAVLVEEPRRSRTRVRPQTVAARRARTGISWRVWAILGCALFLAALTIAGVIVYLNHGANNDAKDENSAASLVDPAAARDARPAIVERKSPQPAKDGERAHPETKPPQPREGTGEAAVTPPPLQPQQGVPPRTVGEVRRFDNHDGPISAIAATADGRTAAVAVADKGVWVWDVTTGKLRHPVPFRYPAPIESLAIKPDGSQLITLYKGNLHRWDLTNLRVTVGPTSGRYLSPDGQYFLDFAGPDDKRIARVWDVARDKDLYRFNNAPNDPTSAAIVPECQRLVVGTAKGEVYLCDWKTLKWRKWQLDKEGALTVALAAQGHRVATSSQSFGVCVWDADTGKLLRRLEGQPAFPGALAISADGRFVLAGSEAGLIRLWHTGSGKVIQEYQGHTGAVTQLVLLSGEQFLSGGVDKTVRLWRLFPGNTSTPPKPSTPTPEMPSVPTTNNPFRRLEGANKQLVQAMTFMPQTSNLLAASWDATVLWNWKNAQIVSKTPMKDHRVTCFAVSPDGRTGLSGSQNKVLRLWNMKTGQPIRDLPGHTTAIWSVTFSADGKLALSAGGAARQINGSLEYEDCAIRVWDVVRMKELRRFEGHAGPVKHLAFLPDGKHVLSLAAGATGSACIWDATTGKEERRLAEASAKFRLTATSSADGRYLLIGSGRIARLWDVETDQEVRQLKGHQGVVHQMAFSRDGKYALTSDMFGDAKRGDSSIHLWDVVTGRELRRYPQHPSQVQRIAFAPDGHEILSAYADGTILVWETGLPAKP
jgi:WD40 repeat protein/serine/threonine protein kinase